MTRFRAEVIAVINVDVDAESPDDAADRARRAASARPWLPSDAIIRVSVEPLGALHMLALSNLRIYQETEALKLGTVNQRERWASGCLPDEELLKIVRDRLFMPFALFRKRQRRGPSAIDHPTDHNGTWLCMESAVDGHVPIEWATTPSSPPPELTATEWATLSRMRAALEECGRHPWLQQRSDQHTNTEVVRLAIREHKGTCASCKRSASERTVLVQIEWAGRTLSREYLL